MDATDADQGETTGPDEAEGTSLPEHAAPLTDASDAAARRRRACAVLLGEFRRTPVLVPTDADDDAPLAADYGGIRWIYAFSNESAPARFAPARGEGEREWPYQRWLGARLLDAGVPAVGAVRGGPGGGQRG